MDHLGKPTASLALGQLVGKLVLNEDLVIMWWRDTYWVICIEWSWLVTYHIVYNDKPPHKSCTKFLTSLSGNWFISRIRVEFYYHFGQSIWSWWITWLAKIHAKRFKVLEWSKIPWTNPMINESFDGLPREISMNVVNHKWRWEPLRSH